MNIKINLDKIEEDKPLLMQLLQNHINRLEGRNSHLDSELVKARAKLLHIKNLLKEAIDVNQMD